MSEAWRVVGWLAAGVFVGLLAIIVVVRLLLRYLDRKVRELGAAAELLKAQGERNQASAEGDREEVARLKRLSTSLSDELRDLNRRLVEAKAQPGPDAASEVSRLNDQSERLLAQITDVLAQLKELERRSTERIEAESRAQRESHRLGRLASRLLPVVRFVELLSDVDITRPRAPGGSQ